MDGKLSLCLSISSWTVFVCRSFFLTVFVCLPAFPVFLLHFSPLILPNLHDLLLCWAASAAAKARTQVIWLFSSFQFRLLSFGASTPLRFRLFVAAGRDGTDIFQFQAWPVLASSFILIHILARRIGLAEIVVADEEGPINIWPNGSGNVCTLSSLCIVCPLTKCVRAAGVEDFVYVAATFWQPGWHETHQHVSYGSGGNFNGLPHQCV